MKSKLNWLRLNHIRRVFSLGFKSMLRASICATLALLIGFIAFIYWNLIGYTTRVITNLNLGDYEVGHVLAAFWILGWALLTYYVFSKGLRN